MAPLDDQEIRLAAFDWLTEQVDVHGDVLPRRLLEQGFILDGERVTLVGPQGIWKPRVMPELPLSIATTTGGPYLDSFSYNDLLLYSYRETDPDLWINRALRKCISAGVPLIYFRSIIPGRCLAVWPVFVVGDDPGNLQFHVSVDEGNTDVLETSTGEGASLQRKYAVVQFRQRLHQRTFRERVLHAYNEQCSLCRLRHRELLEAAHIIPDSEEGGEPVVKNGISLCKLHHAAFDRNFLGIRPDYVVEIRGDLLEEVDGPMLQHGLQELHGSRIVLPRSRVNRPDPELLEQRYVRFRKAG